MKGEINKPNSHPEYFDRDSSATDNPYFAAIDYVDDYDLMHAGMDVPHSPKKRRSNSVTGKGLSRIGSHISTMSNRWKPGRLSEETGTDATTATAAPSTPSSSFPDPWRSRTSSAASSAFVSPPNPVPRVDSTIPPSPARTIFEERLSLSGVPPIDVAKVNRQFEEQKDDDDESTHLATTPLLPPFMGNDPMAAAAAAAATAPAPATAAAPGFGVKSPLQSPTVADRHVLNHPAAIPSPPLSSKPSMTSFHHRPSATTNLQTEVVQPLFLSDPSDEWANQLGHANFTIQPEPYRPDTCSVETFRQLRIDWDVAQCNFAKHLVRTGEHYGVTSNIYKLTEAKWDAVNQEWKRHHEDLLSELEATQGPVLMMGLAKSSFGSCDQVKIPRLHDNAKFPELGDGEIVGPMKIEPISPRPSMKRSFLKFFQDLIGRT